MIKKNEKCPSGSDAQRFGKGTRLSLGLASSPDLPGCAIRSTFDGGSNTPPVRNALPDPELTEGNFGIRV